MRARTCSFVKCRLGMRSFSIFGLDLAFVPDIGLSELVLEKAFVVVPRLLGRAFGQSRQIIRIGDRLAAAALRDFRQ